MPLAARERRFPPKKSALPAAGGRSAPVERKRGKEKQQFRLVFSSSSASQFRLGATHTTRSRRRLRTYVRTCGRPPRYITGGSLEEEEGRRRGSDLFLQALANVKGGESAERTQRSASLPMPYCTPAGRGEWGSCKRLPSPMNGGPVWAGGERLRGQKRVCSMKTAILTRARRAKEGELCCKCSLPTTYTSHSNQEIHYKVRWELRDRKEKKNTSFFPGLLLRFREQQLTRKTLFFTVVEQRLQNT